MTDTIPRSPAGASKTVRHSSPPGRSRSGSGLRGSHG
jgi:hypothetical protein